MNNSIILTLFILFFHATLSSGQDGGCAKLKVGVYLDQMREEVVDHLNSKYGSKSRQAWIETVDNQVLDALRQNSPEIDFFSTRNDKTADPDYIFKYILSLTVVDGEMIFPPDSIVYIDGITGWEVTEYTPAEYDQETAFWMSGGLVVNSPCVPNLRWLIDINLVNDIELEGAIIKLSKSFWRISNIIEYHEQRRLAPAREPELDIKYDREFLSLLEKETRKMKITVKVRNCKGQWVTYKGQNQPMYFEDDLERFDLKASQCLNPTVYKGHMVMQPRTGYYETNGIYTILKGIEPVEQKVSIGTCGISSKSEHFTNGKIIVMGLEVKVKPDKKQLRPGETSTIEIRFDEVDPNGTREPVPGRELNISVKGVVDGSIYPKGNQVTKEDGKVTLKYKAGENDEQVTITASYQPVDYPDKAIGSSSIAVIPDKYNWTGKLTLQMKTDFECTYSSGQVHEEETREQLMEVLLAAENIELAGLPVARIENMMASGSMDVKYHFQRDETKPDYNKVQVNTAEDNCPFKQGEGSLTLLIQRKMTEDPEALKKKMEAMSQSGDMEGLMKMMEQLTSPDMKNGVAVDVVVGAAGPCLGMMFIEITEQSKYKNEHQTHAEELQLALPFQMKMEGMMTLTPEGAGSIIATFEGSEDTPNGMPSSSGCPPKKLVMTGELLLTATKIN